MSCDTLLGPTSWEPLFYSDDLVYLWFSSVINEPDHVWQGPWTHYIATKICLVTVGILPAAISILYPGIGPYKVVMSSETQQQHVVDFNVIISDGRQVPIMQKKKAIFHVNLMASCFFNRPHPLPCFRIMWHLLDTLFKINNSKLIIILL